MKKAITMCALFILSWSISAQEFVAKNSTQIGFTIGQIQQDFGIGLNLTSPYFLYERVAVRVRGNFVFHEHLDNNANFVWTPYSNLTIGLVGLAGKVGEQINVYGEGGLLFLFPNDNFSSENAENGGYGIVGFEFLPARFIRYFIEIGGAGSGASADKVAGSPIYSNGLILYTGIRFAL